MKFGKFFRVMTTGVVMLAVSLGAYAQNPINVKVVNNNIGTSAADIKDGQTATIQFDRFPKTVEEFEQTRVLIGEYPAGAAVLILMAFEMYRREVVFNGKTKAQEADNIGWQCLNKVTSSSCNAMQRVKETFSKDAGYAPKYSKPWQVAAYLKGATEANGFNPTKPYTVEVRSKKGSQQSTYSNDFKSDWLMLQIMTKGCTDGFRGLTVVKTNRPQGGDKEKSGNKYFLGVEISTLLTQVMDASFDVEFKGLD